MTVTKILPIHNKSEAAPQILNGPYFAKTELLYVLLGWLGLTLLTLPYYPLPGMDEVMFLDPAANLALGKGFVSGFWIFLPADVSFSAYPPLYILLESLWISVFGLSLYAVRSLALICAGLVSWMIVKYAVERHLLPRTRDQLAFAILILFSYGFCFSYRSGRPEAFTLLLLAGAWTLINHRNWNLTRGLGLFALGICGAWTGLQVIMFMGLSGMAYFLVGDLTGRVNMMDRFKRCLFWGGGVVFGLGMLLAWLEWQGNRDMLFATVNRASGGGGMFHMLLNGQYDFQMRVPKALSLAIMMGIAGGLLIFSRRIGSIPARRIKWSLAWVLCVAITFLGLGKLPTYYTVVMFVPLSLSVVYALSQWDLQRSMGVSWYMLVSVAGLVGLPALLGISVLNWDQRQASAAEAYLEGRFEAEDVLVTDFSAYYFVRPQTGNLYAIHHLHQLRPEKAAEIDFLVLKQAKDVAVVQELIGGEWELENPPMYETPYLKLQDLLGFRFSAAGVTQLYDFFVYRRKDQSPKASSLPSPSASISRSPFESPKANTWE